MHQQSHYDHLFKIALIGNVGVGKSSLILRFTEGTFNESSIPTIGVDSKIRTFDLSGKTIKLQIWDTAGQEKHKTITSSFYKNSHGIILVYDIADRKSFDDIDAWYSQTIQQANENVIIQLVGNKCDLDENRAVTYEEAKEYADIKGIKFVESSAKDAYNVDKAFFTLANEIKSNLPKSDNPISNSQNQQGQNLNLKDSQSKNQKEGGCC